MERTEKELVTVIANKEQIFDRFPEMFKEKEIGGVQIHMEVPNKAEEEEYLKEERVFILPTGVISIFSKDSEYLWNDIEDDTISFGYFNTYAERMRREWQDGRDISLFERIKIKDKEFGFKYYPYGDPNAADNLLELLERKELAKNTV